MTEYPLVSGGKRMTSFVLIVSPGTRQVGLQNKIGVEAAKPVWIHNIAVHGN